MTKNEFEKVWNEASESLREIVSLTNENEIDDFYFGEIEDFALRAHTYTILSILRRDTEGLLAETDLTFNNHVLQLQKDGTLEKIIDFLEQIKEYK
ncbi:hypothetical protein CCZ01_07840 [Helicobacter monodelphidis]|uniref:hypothetical protein n=1 Tax=Helicobacter sp. 15-1451 TaxID=2004995 RepID=UPI000DCECBB2|nr:hypothetical protein [Helicobacter sp. 15-1451]RAX56955.1 hypothetical protein CCZ01_07840 [Helicobacter sp. 15-1451]